MVAIEIALFIGGIYCLVTAKVPAFLVGGGFYQIERWVARTIGILLMSLLPVEAISRVILGYRFGYKSDEYQANLLFVEIVALFVIGALVLTLTRIRGRQAGGPADNIEAIIAKKTQRALTYAIMSGVFFVIYCPLTFIHANQAINLIEQHSLGGQYLGRAKASRVISVVLTFLSISGWLTYGFMSSL